VRPIEDDKLAKAFKKRFEEAHRFTLPGALLLTAASMWLGWSARKA
jgi:hypothetical protein